MFSVAGSFVVMLLVPFSADTVVLTRGLGRRNDRSILGGFCALQFTGHADMS